MLHSCDKQNSLFCIALISYQITNQFLARIAAAVLRALRRE